MPASKKHRITRAEVIATALCFDLAEMSEYRYQPGWTTPVPVALLRARLA